MQLGVLADDEVRMQQRAHPPVLIVNLLKTVKRISGPEKTTWFVDTIEYYLEKSEVLSFAGEQIKL